MKTSLRQKFDMATTQSEPKTQSSSHSSLGAPVRALLNGAFALGLAVILFFTIIEKPIDADFGQAALIKAIMIEILAVAFWALLVSGVRIAAQWERGVLLRLGKFRGVRGPGIVYVVPFIDNIQFVDTRLLTLNIPSQQVITKDNVPAAVDGVLYVMVTEAEKAVLSVQNYRFAVAQYAQATLRDVVGALTLDELLSERDQIQKRVAEVVEERIKSWGLHLDSIAGY